MIVLAIKYQETMNPNANAPLTDQTEDTTDHTADHAAMRIFDDLDLPGQGSSTHLSRQTWDQIDSLNIDEWVQCLQEEQLYHTTQGQHILLTWLAKRLGKTPRFHKKRRGHASLLYPLLHPKRFQKLDEQSTQALMHLAHSTPSARPTLSEEAAISALILWVWSDPWASDAEAILREKPLPDDPIWLMHVLKKLETGHSQRTPTFVLAQLALSCNFWNVASLIATLHLTHRYSNWKSGPIQAHMIRACDKVAQSHPSKERHWLELIADATIGGRLDHPWLERLMSACIRLNIDHPARQQTLRDFDQHKPYEASPQRLARLYRAHLDQFRQQRRQTKDARRLTPGLDLRAQVDHLKHTHPSRAQTLLELLVIEQCAPRRPGTHTTRLEHAFARLRVEDFETLNLEDLVAFYIKTIALDPTAAAFVHKWQHRVQWTQHTLASPDDLNLYLIVSDYDRAFKHLTCKYDGMRLHHADKHAAEKLKYFIERRAKIQGQSQLKRLPPVEWVGDKLASARWMQNVTNQAVRVFEQRMRNQDLSEKVVEALQNQGLRIDAFEDVAQVSLDHIQVTLRQQSSRRIVLGALIGGISGGLAPLSWSVLSVSDIPVLLALCADICSRFCWYYGFNPNEHPDLPMTILAVALGGVRADAIEPMLVRHNLQEFLLRKSFVLNAFTRSTIKQLAGRTLQQGLEHYLGPQIANTAQSLARRAVSRNLQQRAAQVTPTKKVPVVGMVLSATINGALLYDLCEAAQAVLTDRFLERKYPDWSSALTQAKQTDVLSLD